MQVFSTGSDNNWPHELHVYQLLVSPVLMTETSATLKLVRAVADSTLTVPIGLSSYRRYVRPDTFRHSRFIGSRETVMYLCGCRLQAEHSGQSHRQSPREPHLVRLQSTQGRLGRSSRVLARGCTRLAV